MLRKKTAGTIELDQSKILKEKVANEIESDKSVIDEGVFTEGGPAVGTEPAEVLAHQDSARPHHAKRVLGVPSKTLDERTPGPLVLDPAPKPTQEEVGAGQAEAPAPKAGATVMALRVSRSSSGGDASPNEEATSRNKNEAEPQSAMESRSDTTDNFPCSRLLS